MRRTRPASFLGILVCKGCNYRLRWRVRDREWFPRKWDGECPHCGGKFRSEGVE